jgi:hypothetical protein
MIFISYQVGLFLNNTNNTKPVEINDDSDDEPEAEQEQEQEPEPEQADENFNSSEESEDKYTSILFKSFMIMTKKQLLKITGNKYKNSNKDELIIIAMTKFIVNSIENYNYMPIDSKNFVKKNKEIMKEEFYELYKIHKMNQNMDKVIDEISESENEVEEELDTFLNDKFI